MRRQGSSNRRVRAWAATAVAVIAAAAIPASAAATTNPFVEATGSMSAQHASPVAVTLPGGDVLVAGGLQFMAPQDHAGEGSKRAEVFDPSTGSFTLLGDEMSVARRETAGAVLGDGRVLIAGGNSGTEAWSIAKAETYDPASEEFSATAPMGTPRAGLFAASLPDGTVLVGGGNQWGKDSEGKTTSTRWTAPRSTTR